MNNNERIDHITERLAALESKKQSNLEKEEKELREMKQQQDGWRPRHSILGGWPDRTAREVVESEAAPWLSTAPQQIQEACLGPFAPKKYGEIIKVKENMVNDVGWQIARLLEKRVAGGKSPTWSAVERSPEEGKRRRLTTKASERALKVSGPEFEVERNGSIYRQGIEIAKYGGSTQKWIPKAGWCRLAVGGWNEFSKRRAAA